MELKKEYQAFAEKIARKAGDIILHHFDTELESHIKDEDEVVTVADEEVNQMVIQEVDQTFPSHSVLGEEASNDKKSDLVWVCDPIDGTIPFTSYFSKSSSSHDSSVDLLSTICSF